MTLHITSGDNIAGFGASHDFKRYPSTAFGKDRNQAVLPASAWGTAAVATNSSTGLFNTVVDGTKDKCLKDVFTYCGDRATSQWTSSQGVNIMSHVPESVKRWGENEIRYYNALRPATLLGITTENLISRQRRAGTIWGKWRSSVSANYAGFFKNLKAGQLITASGETVPLTVKNYLRYSVLGEHTRKVADFLSGNGKPVSAALSMIGPALMIWSAVKVMRQAYAQSSQKQDGFFSRIFKTAIAGFKEMTKQIASYHIGSIAFACTAALIPVGGIVTTVAALAAAITAGVISSKLITKAIGPSVKENRPLPVPVHLNRT